ncbi:MAG: carboxylating nicotinate-nucleotide diphosphorylase [Ignavibacteriaceae bacterium]|nr:carboxylating nicotinate-nucleotide diphosphorylase [Ignavibacteriaceae bacterium]
MVENITDIIFTALKEDIGTGDITTIATIPDNVLGKGIFLIKDDGVIAGLDVTEQVFKTINKDLVFLRSMNDGAVVKNGDIVAIVEGSAASILTAERTALNFMQRMSGIATMASQFREKVKHTKAKIIDTRKTVPGLRFIDKLAVRIGGCENHRMGLYDMFLIKDNHIAVAGSITNAVKACRNYRDLKSENFLIEVETTNLVEVSEALQSGANIIMLDNFELGEMTKAVSLINGNCKVEASGGVNFNTVKNIAETGVDFISVGALTHSVKALDISLEVQLSRTHAR